MCDNFNPEWYYNFIPDVTTLWEKIRLFFIPMITDWEVIFQDDIVKTQNYTNHKTLHKKKFILDKGGMTSVSLGTINLGEI